MKWVFRAILLIFLVFACLVVAGYFAPGKIEVERSTQIDAYPEDIFPYLNDLRMYDRWSALHFADPSAKFIYGGADNGIGQTAVWKSDHPRLGSGLQEITASAPNEFVQLNYEISGQSGTAFYGIAEDENVDGVIVLFRTEVGLGGFPYIQRLAAKNSQQRMELEFDLALNRLKTIVEADVAEN